MKEKKLNYLREKEKIKMNLEKEESRKFFRGEPLLNVISKEEFQNRVEHVFRLISNTLSCSFGAYGSPTIISNYPYTHVTKDGYTIFKNLTFDNQCGSAVDSTIANMIGDICGRLNYKVGDGTTTAIVATSEIYNSYYRNRKFFDDNAILPRDIIKEFRKVKDEIVEKIYEKTTNISEDKEEMLDAIRKIVNISSNGDEELTDMIVEIYDKIGYPSISVELAKDNVTKYDIIEGFRTNVFLTDKIYINTDDNFCERKNLDVLIFDHRVETECYEYIIKPLHQMSRTMGRSFLVIAPSYSEMTMSTVIQKDIMNEYRETKNTSLIITTCRSQTATAKRSLSDLAMLLNTTIIDRDFEKNVIREIASKPEEDPYILLSYFNYDRKIENQFFIMKNEDGQLYSDKNISETDIPLEKNERGMDIGFTGSCRIGIDYSVFTDFHYDSNLYHVFLDDAKETLDDLVEKYAKMGTFNYEVTEAMKRYSALQLKTAVIQAGGDSELSKAMLKDTIDDAIRAADSAYNNGYILGCNVTTSSVIRSMIAELHTIENPTIQDVIKERLLCILSEGFYEVYRTVLGNAFNDFMFTFTNGAFRQALLNKEIMDELAEKVNETIQKFLNIEYSFDTEFIREVVDTLYNENESDDKEVSFNIFTLIITKSLDDEEVFDLVSKTYSKDIINSAATDVEVLTAIIDLMNILITGNQLVVTGKHNF